MRVLINENGDLKVFPQNVGENYLIKKWAQDWVDGKVGMSFSWREGNQQADMDVFPPPDPKDVHHIVRYKPVEFKEDEPNGNRA